MVFRQRPAVIKIIEFSHRHRWTKYFCAAAVSVIYAHDCTSDLIFRSRQKVRDYVRENGSAIPVKLLSGLTAAAFAVMTVPFSAAAEGASGIADTISSVSVQLAAAKAESEMIPEVGLPEPVSLSDKAENNAEKQENNRKIPKVPEMPDEADIGLPAAVRSSSEKTILSLYNAANTASLLDVGTAQDNVEDSSPEVNAAEKTDPSKDDSEENSAKKDSEQNSAKKDSEQNSATKDSEENPAKKDSEQNSAKKDSEQDPAKNNSGENRDFTVTVRGLPETDSRYSLEYYYEEDTLTDDVIAELIGGTDNDLELVCKAFEAYSIERDTLNIVPFELNLYDAKGNELQLGKYDRAEVVVPVPDDMKNHIKDLRVVRAEEQRIEILDSEYIENPDGTLSVRFVADHFSIFALVAYQSEPEDIQSSAGSFAGADISASALGINIPDVFEERRKNKKSTSRKFRVIRKMRKKDIIF